MTKHVHEKEMLQYMEDWKTTNEPWKLWSVAYHVVTAGSETWMGLMTHPDWRPDAKYRRIRNTELIEVNGISGLEAPAKEPLPFGTRYWKPSKPSILRLTWENEEADFEALRNGQVFLSKDATEKMWQAVMQPLVNYVGYYDF